MMENFLQDFQFDRYSFWLGFLTASLFWWLVIKLSPGIRRIVSKMRSGFQESRQKRAVSIDIYLRNDLIHYVQGMHLAAPLFSLDEIGLPARIQPSSGIRNLQKPTQNDLPIHQGIPDMPDWPEMGSTYQVPSLTLAEAFESSHHILVAGPLGSGKTVALAQFASSVARQEKLPKDKQGYIPLWIHAAWLAHPLEDSETLLQRIENSLKTYLQPRTQAKLGDSLPVLLARHNTLVFIDGMDELSPPEINQVAAMIRILAEAYPQIRIIASAYNAYHGQLSGHGFTLYSISTWDFRQRVRFLERWTELWQLHVGPTAGALETSETSLLNAWINNQVECWSPFVFTLMVWAMYAGDIAGFSSDAHIEAYLKRMLLTSEGEINADARQAIQALAFQQVMQSAALAFQTNASRPGEISQKPSPDSMGSEQDSLSSTLEIKNISRMRGWADVERSGLVSESVNREWRCNYPIIAAYLAVCEIHSQEDNGDNLIAGWLKTGSQLCSFAAGYLVITHPNPDHIVDRLLEDDQAPFYDQSLAAGHWLQLTPKIPAWGGRLLRRLAEFANDAKLPYSQRCRAITALVTASPPGISSLLHQMLTSPQPDLRRIGALGSGLVRGMENLDDLISLLKDPNPGVVRAAALAIAVKGIPRGLDALAETLLHGSEFQREIAAQALALHPEEGHLALKEGSTFEDLLVRRAVVPGLAQINQPWSRELLVNMVLEDSQWVVKNAAQQALEALDTLPPNKTGPHPPLDETPWLVDFASQKRLVLPKGMGAESVLIEALVNGSEEQQLMALFSIQSLGLFRTVDPVWELYQHGQGKVQEAAFETLYRLRADGFIPYQ